MEVEKVLKKYPVRQREDLIPMLQDMQDLFGYLPEFVLPEIASHLGLPLAKIYSVATYYNQFHFEKQAKYHIQICEGVGCQLYKVASLVDEVKKQLEIDDGEMTNDQVFSLELVPCLGACHLAPVININGILYGQLNNRKLIELLDHLRNE